MTSAVVDGTACGLSGPPARSLLAFLRADLRLPRTNPRCGEGEGGARLSVLNTPMDVWRQVYEVNLFSTIWLAQGLMHELAAARGAIVNVTSIAGSRVHPFAGAAYATSKAALNALTREMAADFGPMGVRVNAIAPGEIDTAILSPGTDKLVQTIPLRRLGLPEEVAKAIYYLCTDQSS